jgi:hypothetical protein
VIGVPVPPFDPGTDPSAYLYEAMAAHIEARYGAAVLTGRHAVRTLAVRGLLVTRAAKGTFVL